MNNLFERTSASWVRYDDYEWREGPDGSLYLTPTSKAKPDIFDPLKNAETLVLDALSNGRLFSYNKSIQNFHSPLQI